jgi:hypothetical protein
LDVRINLMGLGGAFECGCHTLHGDDPVWQRRYLEHVARREGWPSGEAVLMEIYRLRRLDKWSEEAAQLRRAV